jgi:hypothetical protein
MIESSCHCGAIKLEIRAEPEEVNDCNCSICRRYGVLWADCYLWGEKSIEFHRCQHCGCVTHWAAVDQHADRMGVNARLMAPEILAAARLRRSDGANM